jgi:hypothetical protein
MVRGLAVALLLAAAGWLGLVAPARRERDQARAEYARARQDRERLRTDLAALKRRARVGVAPSDEAAAGRALRLALLRATEGLPVEAVQIAAKGEHGGVAARGRLSAEGEMAALLRVAERLVDPAAGVRIEHVVLAPARGASDDTMRLQLDGTIVGAGS